MGAVVRQVDELGRVVIPIEVRRSLGIDAGAPLEFLVDGDRIVLRRYEPGCTFCGEVGELVEHRGRWVCRRCLLAFARRAAEA